ncbi:hypothetical protein [Pontibacillus salipaludis]|uniref:hypothetical protein n=1 Tax=Pontibacillus salipaludis TaxID=1697394 RepID=UPI0031E8E19F
MKRLLSILGGLSLIFVLSTSVSAATQTGNSDVYLGQYSVLEFGYDYSDYCTATESHMILQVNNTSGTVDYIVQQRGPGEGWSNMWSTNGRTSSAGTNIDLNVEEGHDYRLRFHSDLFWADGYSSCI